MVRKREWADSTLSKLGVMILSVMRLFALLGLLDELVGLSGGLWITLNYVV